MTRVPLTDRFQEKIMADPNSGCWLWTANLNNHGYGTISLGGMKSKIEKAHRVSYMLHKGEIPPGMYVLHKCDIRSCCNPDHLFLGSNAENMADMVAKGRQCLHQGVTNGRAVLSDDDIRTIRGLRGKEKQRDTAKTFGVAYSLIHRIQTRKSWGHVADIPEVGTHV